MFVCPTTPAVQSLYYPAKPSKPAQFVISTRPPRTSSCLQQCCFSAPGQLLWYCNSVAHCCTASSKLIEPLSSFPHAVGRNTGRTVWRKVWKIKFEDHDFGRGLGGGDCTTVTKEGFKARCDDGLEGGRGEGEVCYTLKEGMEPEQASSSGRVLPHSAAARSSGMEGKTFWSKLSQNVNLSGVFFSARVIVKDRHLAIPHVNVPDISWIDWRALRAKGFEGVLFDKDNTLTAPYEQNIWPPVKDALEECREVFGGRIALLSNSAGLYQYDPLGEEAKLVEDSIAIPVIRHGQKKPAGNAIGLTNYFGCDSSMLIMVGDRYFTDVVYGNSNGLLTIRPAPLTALGEPFTLKRVRAFEDKLVDWWRQHGALPPKHKLFDNPFDFIKDPGCW